MYLLCSRAQVTRTLHEAKHWSGPPFAALGANPGAHPRCAVAFWCVLVRRGPPVTPISSAVHGPPSQLLPRQEWAPTLARKNSPGLGAASSKPPPRKAPYRSSVGQLQRQFSRRSINKLTSSRPTTPSSLRAI
ncbi:uncharacterized protein TrAtP1_004657 [Trichoderma atroviride]|uniref:uncharacterized protein n=1 Tax=Hypocrea atroviridis TaxID=63577 RepID=UPI003327A0DE|nr:hypothetical protein TrAtP1_004657 [Trichoderma atroviride]